MCGAWVCSCAGEWGGILSPVLSRTSIYSCCGGNLVIHGYVLYLSVELLVKGEAVVYHDVVLMYEECSGKVWSFVFRYILVILLMYSFWGMDEYRVLTSIGA